MTFSDVVITMLVGGGSGALCSIVIDAWALWNRPVNPEHQAPRAQLPTAIVPRQEPLRMLTQDELMERQGFLSEETQVGRPGAIARAEARRGRLRLVKDGEREKG